MDAKLLMESENYLKVKLETKEKEFQENCKDVEIQSANVSAEIDTNSLLKVMSQIGLNDNEFTKLKQHIKEFEEKNEKE